MKPSPQVGLDAILIELREAADFDGKMNYEAHAKAKQSIVSLLPKRKLKPLTSSPYAEGYNQAIDLMRERMES